MEGFLQEKAQIQSANTTHHRDFTLVSVSVEISPQVRKTVKVSHPVCCCKHRVKLLLLLAQAVPLGFLDCVQSSPKGDAAAKAKSRKSSFCTMERVLEPETKPWAPCFFPKPS